MKEDRNTGLIVWRYVMLVLLKPLIASCFMCKFNYSRVHHCGLKITVIVIPGYLFTTHLNP